MLMDLIKSGDITIEELTRIPDLIERAKFVTEALEACKKTLSFPFGVEEIKCYRYVDSCGEYEAWGSCTSSGYFHCWTNWGGDHKIGQVKLTNPTEVFCALDNKELGHNLERFLKQQIKVANQH